MREEQKAKAEEAPLKLYLMQKLTIKRISTRQKPDRVKLNPMRMNEI